MNVDSSKPAPGQLQPSMFTAVGLVLLLFGLKLVYVSNFRIDSDETQHLHVVWGWANGLLPYRDVFDNHSPLFQFLCSPLLRALGERADIVVPMRLLVVSLYFLSLWFVYRSGSILFSPLVGIWAAVVAGAFPTFFIKSSEFRTDDLWVVFWLMAIWALLRPPFKTSTALIFGLALGASFASSLKTMMLAIGLIVAAALVLIRKIARGDKINWQALAGRTVLAGLATAVLPVCIVAFFAAKGALPNLYYCTIQHNIVPRPATWAPMLKQVRWFVPFVAITCIACWRICRQTTESWKRERVVLVTVGLVGSFVLLGGFWPIVQYQDFMPFIPPMGLLVTGAIMTASPSPQRRGRSYEWLFLPVIVAVELAALFYFEPPRANAMAQKQKMISTALSLTTRNDFVMDAKGEFVFRRRAFYFVIEGITLGRLQTGRIKDDIPEHLILTQAPLATLMRMPPRAHAFIEKNYVPIAFRTRVLGKMFNFDSGGLPTSLDFDVAIPERYVVVSENGRFRGNLDGAPAERPQFLRPGQHQLEVLAKDTGRVALIWARAAEKGFSPFALSGNDKAGPED